MIPMIVHQLWLNPMGSVASAETVPIPQDISENIASWKRTHPGVDQRVWTLPGLTELLRDVDGIDVLEAVNVSRFPTMQSNLIRLSLLYRIGGFWSDLKNIVQKPFLHELVDSELVLAEHQPMPEPKAEGYLTNSFIGAVPGHAFIRQCLHEGVAGVQQRLTGSLSAVTGLVLMNRMMRRAKNENRVPPHRLLSRGEAWSEMMRRSKASYQQGGRHWSILQTTEPLYFDSESKH